MTKYTKEAILQIPILYSSLIDFMTDDVFLLIPFLFSEVQIYNNTDNRHDNPGK